MKVGNLRDWQTVKTGEVIAFPSEAERRVEFECLTDGPVAVIATVIDEDGVAHEVPVAQGEGRLAVAYVANGNSACRIIGAAARIVSVRGIARSAVVPASDEASFASAMTGGRRNDEVSRMLYVMKLNEKRRDERMAFTIAEMKAQAAAEAAAQEPAPEPDPVMDEPDAAPSA